MGVVVYYQAKFGRLGDYIPALAPVAATYLLTIIYALYLGWGSSQRRFAYLQLLLDQFLITWIIYCTGGLNSPFTFMYVLVIVASVFYGKSMATYALAGMSTVLYGGMVYMEHLGYIKPFYPFPPLADPTVFYFVFLSIMVNTITFFFVAAMSSHITRLLSKTGEELAQKIEDFTMLQAFHENVLNNMGLGFMAIGLDRRVLSTNPAAEKILKMSREDLLREKVEDVLQLEELKEYFFSIESLDNDDKRYHWVYKDPESEDVYLSMAVNKFIMGDKVQGVIAAFQDVTELKMMERSMADSERLAAIGKVAAVIAHEIRNPLASLSGSIQMLSSDLSSFLDEHSQRLMKITMREADRLNNIITDFLDYSSPPNLDRQSTNLNEIINEVVTLLRSSPKLPGGVDIKINVQEGLLAYVDQEGIKQVIWNILLNAVDVMPDGGTLSIDASRETGSYQNRLPSSIDLGGDKEYPWVRINIEDTGEGIEDDVMENIFEPFFTTKTKGTGLGLPSAKKIVESHGGKIEAISNPGKGSSFILWLPVLPQETLPAGEPSPPGAEDGVVENR